VGPGATAVTGWGENVYLSADTLLDVADYRLATGTHGGALASGAGYDGQASEVIPNGMSGTYWVLVQANVADANGANNLRASAAPLAIRLTPAPNLVVTDLSCAAQGTAGQPLTVRWTTANQGPGVTLPGHWTTTLYLSTDPLLDGSDLQLGALADTSALGPGGSAGDSLVVSIPGWASGPFYLFGARS
jgi:hypothetical protein